MKNKNSPLIALLCILATLSIFFAGCTSDQTSTGPKGEGFTDITPRDDIRRVPLSEAVSVFENLNSGEGPGSSQLHIYYIRGESIDSNGSAMEWGIGALTDQNPVLFVYSAKGYQFLNVTSGLPSEEIDIKDILSPEDLLKQRPLLIDDLTEGGMRDIDSLEIRDSVSIMTYRSEGKVRIFYFDAFSGTETGQK